MSLSLILVGVGLTACAQSAAVAPGRPAWMVVSPGNGAAAVRWGVPAQHDDITGYVATAEPGGRSCRSETASDCLLAGLTNGTGYTVSVRSVGHGGTSTPLSARVTVGTPWPPGALTAAAGDSGATLTWRAPRRSPGGPVTDYTVVSSPPARQCVTAGTSCTITGLANDATYAFAVYATNTYGRSAASTSTTVTPSATAGGSTGIDYLGPVTTTQESKTGTTLQRDSGISVALPNHRDLWIFGDTSSFTAASNQSSAFIAGSTAARGKFVPGHTPTALKDIQPAGSPSTTSDPSPFLPAPTDTYMPDGSGRSCSPANGATYTARWPTGATLLGDQQVVLITYTDVCVTSVSSFTVEGWGFTTYGWRVGKILTPPDDVFPPSADGAPLAPDRAYQSPLVAGGNVTVFTSTCSSLFVVCGAGTVSATTLSDSMSSLSVPSHYVAQSAVTDGSAPWSPVNVSVAAYPSGLRLIEQTSINGTFLVYSSAAPTGPWRAVYSGTLPGCSTTPTGFCYSFNGHPEFGTGTGLVLSYFKPDSPGRPDQGHVDLALVPLSVP